MMSYGGFTLPKGFRFQPSDEELLSYYLEKKNQRKDSHITAIIPEIEVCKHEPRDLPALVSARAEFMDRALFTMVNSPDREWYFFSPIVYKRSESKSKSKSTRIERSTKEGSWKKQGDDRRITGDCSDKQIGGKRILTFYLSNKQKTDWVIHEYYLTDTDSGEQIGDFVLCRLKDNRLKNKSGKSDRDQQNAAFGGGGEPGSGSCSMVSNFEDQASKGLGNVLPITDYNDVEAEHDGSSCGMALRVENPASKPLENVLPDPNGHDDDAEHGFDNGKAENFMLTEAEEYQAFEVLRDIFCESDHNEQEVRGSRTDPCYKDSNHLSLCVEGQPDSFNSPDSEMFEELPNEPENLALLHPHPAPPLQSPIYTKLGTPNFLNDECRKRKYAFGYSDASLTKKNHTDEVDINTLSNSENQAADAIPEGDIVICRLKNKSDEKDCSVSNEREPSSASVSVWGNQAADEMNEEGNPQQPPEDCCSSAMLSPASLELEAVLQTNGTNDDCNERQSPFGDSESCLVDRNEVSTCDDGENVCDVFPQLYDPPEKNLDSIFGKLQPQNYQPSVILHSPIYTKQGNVADANLIGEYNNWQSAFKNNISTNEFYINNENQATDYGIIEARMVPDPQTEVNLESAIYPFQPKNSTLLPQMYTNFGEALHNYECNEFQFSFGDNDYPLTKFLNTNSAYFQDYYSCDQAAEIPFTPSCQSYWEGSGMGIVE